MSYLNNWWGHFFGGMEYPYTDSCKYNDDWLLNIVKMLVEEFANFVNLNTIKYADPIGWDITRQYEANTIVVDNRTGNAYISSKPVPAGVQINNTEYWSEIYNYANVIDTLREQIATNEGNTTTASKPLNEGQLVFVSEKLYRVISDIIAGDSFVVDSNIKETTIEAEIARVAETLQPTIDAIIAAIGDLTNLTTTDKSSLVNAINEVLNDFLVTVGSLDNLQTTDKSSLVNAINEIVYIIGDLSNLTTTDKSSLVNAINEIVNKASNIMPLDVTLHGVVGDGVTNNVSAMLDIIHDYPNYAYYFPKGTYIFTGGSFAGNLNLVGDGDAILVNFVYENLNFPQTNRETVYNTNQDFFSASNLKFQNTGDNYGLTIHVQSQSSVLRTFDIRNCVFDGSNGLRLINCITGNISSCDFIHNVRGIKAESSTNITIAECNWYSPIIGIDIGTASDDTAGRKGGESIMLTACQMIDGVTGILAKQHNYLELVNCMFDYLNMGLFLNASRYARIVNTYFGYDEGDKSSMSGYIAPPNYGCLYGYSNVNGIPFSFEAINAEFTAYGNAAHIPVVADGGGSTDGEDIDVIACRFTAISTANINTLLYLLECSDVYVDGNRFYAPSNNYLSAPYVFTSCSRVINSNSDYANCFKSNATPIIPSAANSQTNRTYQECHTVTVTGNGSSGLAQQAITFDATYDNTPVVVANCVGGTDYYKLNVSISSRSASGCTINLYDTTGGLLNGNYTVDVIVMHKMF